MKLKSVSLCVLLGSLAACAGSRAESDGSLRIAIKGDKQYQIGGEVLSFVELESLLSAQRPPRLIIEESPQILLGSCVFVLGAKMGIPVWMRSLNGSMQPVQFNIDAPDITATSACR